MAQAVGSWHLPGFLQGFLPFRTSACTPHQSSSLPIVPALAPPTLVTEYRCICIYRLYRHTYIQYICIYFTTKYKFTLKPVEFGLFGFFFFHQMKFFFLANVQNSYLSPYIGVGKLFTKQISGKHFQARIIPLSSICGQKGKMI